MNDEITSIILSQIKEIEAKDESQIMQELAGETVREMIYSVDVKDRKTGKWAKKHKLSWAGAKEAARYKGNIVVDESPIVTDLEDSIRVVVKVTDLARNLSIFGGCHQPKKMKVYDLDKNGEPLDSFHYKPDDYAFQKALSKAQRNAFYTILPADHIAKMIDRFIKLSTRPALKEGKAEALQPPTKADAKANAAWDSVSQEMVPDYNALERVFWDITKKQPAEMYKQLGVKNRLELSITPWDAFLQLKERFAAIPV